MDELERRDYALLMMLLNTINFESISRIDNEKFVMFRKTLTGLSI